MKPNELRMISDPVVRAGIEIADILNGLIDHGVKVNDIDLKRFMDSADQMPRGYSIKLDVETKK